LAYQVPANLAVPIRIMPPQSALTSQDYLQVGQTASFPGEENQGQGVDYAISGTTIYSNTDGAVLEYVPSNAMTSQFAPAFNQALYTMLAAKLVMPLTKDRNRRLELEQEATLRIDQALALSGNVAKITYGDDLPPIIREMLS
jgi:hypothetical protein